MAQAQLDRVRARFNPLLTLLRRAFLALPESLGCYSETDSPVAAALNLYENLQGASEYSRASALLMTSFGSLDRITIPEHGARLKDLVAQLAVAIDGIVEEPHLPEELDVIEDWIRALISTSETLSSSTEQSVSVSACTPPPARRSDVVGPPSAPDNNDRAQQPVRIPQTVIPRQLPVPHPLQVSGMREAKQSKLIEFSRLTRDEQRRREADEAEERAARRALALAAEMENQRLLKERKKENANERQRLCRQRKRERKVRMQRAQLSAKVKEDLARGGRKKYHKDGASAAEHSHRRIRKQGGKAQPQPPKRKKTTWARKALYPFFQAAVDAVGFKSPSAIVTYVQGHDVTGMFQDLDADVLRKWIAKNEYGEATGWTKSFLDRVAQDGANSSAGRKRLLVNYKDIFDGALSQLRATRDAHASITVPVTRAILVAHARLSGIPELARCKFSAHMVLELQDHQKLLRQAHARISAGVKFYSVPHPSLVVNDDQAGFSIMPGGKKTWAERGAAQVTVHGHDEKRQMTMVVASSCSGEFLPFQTVWGGKSQSSLPSPAAHRWEEAEAAGFQHAHGDTRHWSSRDSTKKWIETVLLPYYHRICKQHGFKKGQNMLLLIDVWPIHTAKSRDDDFLPWLKREYPWIRPYFIPGGCTGIFQPADVGLQRIIKHIFRTSATDWVVGTVTRQLAAGNAPADVVIPTSLPILRDACIAWALDAYNHMVASPELVRQAWARCEVGELNLSWESLTSDAATSNYMLQMKDPEFAAQFASFDTIVPLPDDLSSLPEETITFTEHDDDDTALSTTALADHVLSGVIPPQCHREADGSLQTEIADDEDDVDDDEEDGAESGVFELDNDDSIENADDADSACSDADDSMAESENESTDEDEHCPTSADESGRDLAQETDDGPPDRVGDRLSSPSTPISGWGTSSEEEAGMNVDIEASETELSAPKFLLNIAVIGGTNSAAVQAPATDAERKAAIKKYTQRTKHDQTKGSRAGAPTKSRPTKPADSSAPNDDHPLTVTRKRGRPGKAQRPVQEDAPTRELCPRKPTQYAEQSSESASERDNGIKLRSTKRGRRG